MAFQTLRQQMRELAEKENYEYIGHPSPKAHACDIYVRPYPGGERTVQIGYTTGGDRIVALTVNGDKVFPAGKWPTIDALIPRLVLPQDDRTLC
jgi:hypothetical protein